MAAAYEPALVLRVFTNLANRGPWSGDGRGPPDGRARKALIGPPARWQLSVRAALRADTSSAIARTDLLARPVPAPVCALIDSPFRCNFPVAAAGFMDKNDMRFPMDRNRLTN